MECENPTSSLLNYAGFYYCVMGGQHALALVLLIVWLLYVFLIFSTAVSSFFVPNIQWLTKALSLSETVAGVTLAALGNGAPDIFSSVAAFANGGTNELGVGVLLGGSLFVIMVVVGVIALLHDDPFPVAKRPFLRDICAFLGALVMLLVIIADGKITIVESTVLIVYYLVYVLVVVVAHVIYRRQKRNLPIRAPSESQVPDLQGRRSDEGAWVDESSHLLSDDELSDVNVLNFNIPVIEISHTPTLVPLFAEESKFHHILQSLSPFTNGWVHAPLHERLTGLALLPVWMMLRLTIPVVTDEYAQREPSLRLPSPLVERAFLGLNADGTLSVSPESASPEEIDVYSDEGAEDDLPRDLSQTDTSSFRYITEALSLKTGLLPSPRVDWHQPQQVWHKWLTVINCALFPWVFAFSFIGLSNTTLGVPSWVVALLFSLAGGSSAYFFLSATARPKLLDFLSVLGFLSGIAWIYVIANELVGILSTMGQILQIPDAILGLTVFAIGNSSSDLITDIAMARMGMGRMAIAAAFGGPLLSG
ncbi:hypothetical protein M427DRAFT_144609 [Gonapodya prolifera JEL478]|uniref:Sodium/calcium exchanger membrane region domain-containing protein n=1 Tax=Gonapodya prolifera (strain JEL478) TaxID=1344416 RepID=A0A139AJ04_GONPJ|nr:hypothetical protein M427DRAFT_144609 [Gonapodya prolifera JEL478]|eukprot:KXS16791.1 hypothetical protein M427DRAFT_144609 [Gonapodya prolifera JEL478]